MTVGYVDIDRTIKKSKGPYMYCLNNATGVDDYQFNRSMAPFQPAVCPIWDIPLPPNVTFCPSTQVCLRTVHACVRAVHACRACVRACAQAIPCA